MQSSSPVFAPTSHIKMTRPSSVFILHFISFFLKPKWNENSVQTAKGLGPRQQNADTCATEQLKYRSLDGEATECRLCKCCGCMLNTSDYTSPGENLLACGPETRNQLCVVLLLVVHMPKNMCTKCVPSPHAQSRTWPLFCEVNPDNFFFCYSTFYQLPRQHPFTWSAA